MFNSRRLVSFTAKVVSRDCSGPVELETSFSHSPRRGLSGYRSLPQPDPAASASASRAPGVGSGNNGGRANKSYGLTSGGGGGGGDHLSLSLSTQGLLEGAADPGASSPPTGPLPPTPAETPAGATASGERETEA